MFTLCIEMSFWETFVRIWEELGHFSYLFICNPFIKKTNFDALIGDVFLTIYNVPLFVVKEQLTATYYLFKIKP